MWKISYKNKMKLILFLKNIGVRVSILSKAFEISESTIYSWDKKVEEKTPPLSFKSYLAIEIMPELLKRKEALDNLIEELKIIIDS